MVDNKHRFHFIGFYYLTKVQTNKIIIAISDYHHILFVVEEDCKQWKSLKNRFT